ncbi:MAG TPA: adenylate/guanylate cyclase domain-containing protein [Burkholderiales bacterium]|nr:adenylate/guanylate cyclase domain-containing protein [Burkholderiales bacterium]
MPPETRYARSGDVHIAYQVIGSGAIDLVVVPGFVSHVEGWWQEPASAQFFERLAAFTRLILFDKRGTGLSDRVADVPTLEVRMDDLRAVMAAAGSERAALLGVSEGGAMSALFAATYPERTSALVLYGTFAQFSSWVPSPQHLARFLRAIDENWGTGNSLPHFAPSAAQDERLIRWWGHHERLGASPGAAMALMRMNSEIDVRHVLPTIRVPTLVLHRTGDVTVNVEAGRYQAAHIPEAKYVELPGIDHIPFIGDAESILGEIEEFLTGVRPIPEPDRVLATVLFTDIVGSTELAARLGDRGWRDLLEAHHALVRQELVRFRGREVDTAGDGFLATFDGPARAVRCACAISDTARPLGITVRAGLHTGECEVIGEKLGGIAVHTGARVVAIARPNEVLVSRTVKDLVGGSGLRFADRGVHLLKGLPTEWQLFAVER